MPSKILNFIEVLQPSFHCTHSGDINKHTGNEALRIILHFTLAGKLNALEDWRLARLDLMHKFETQEERIAKQEESHKTALYETEKSVIITKAK